MQNHEPHVPRSPAELWEPLCPRGFCRESEGEPCACRQRGRWCLSPGNVRKSFPQAVPRAGLPSSLLSYYYFFK